MIDLPDGWYLIPNFECKPNMEGFTFYAYIQNGTVVGCNGWKEPALSRVLNSISGLPDLPPFNGDVKYVEKEYSVKPIADYFRKSHPVIKEPLPSRWRIY